MDQHRWVFPLGLVVGLLMVAGSWYFLREAARIRDFRRHAVEAIADVRSIGDCRTNQWGGTRCRVLAAFVTEDGETIQVDERVFERDMRYVSGSQMSVLYDTRDPAIVRFDRPTGTFETLLALGVLGVGGFLLAGVFLSEEGLGLWNRWFRSPRPGRPGWNLLPPDERR